MAAVVAAEFTEEDAMKRRSFFWLALAPILAALKLETPKEKWVHMLMAWDIDGSVNFTGLTPESHFENAKIWPSRYVDLSKEADRRLLLEEMR